MMERALSPAERMRRYRERQQRGIQIYFVELDDDDVESLVSEGYLSWVDSDDRKKVGFAIVEKLRDI